MKEEFIIKQEDFCDSIEFGGHTEICGSKWATAEILIGKIKVHIYYTTNERGSVDYVNIDLVKKDGDYFKGMCIHTEPLNLNMQFGLSDYGQDWDETYRPIEKWLDYPNLEYSLSKISKYLK
jgi:hypothetical protein